MLNYKFKINLPGWYSSRGLENTACFLMRRNNNTRNIYDVVGDFEDDIFKSLVKNLEKDKVQDRQELKSILNIHDLEGLRSPSKIRRLQASIEGGRDILARSGMPNIKILRLKNKQLFLFDGHHSLLAYMLSGRKYLHQIPYLLLECKDEKRLLDHNFLNFFGHHLKWKRREKWRNYTINWNARGRKQLQERKQKNMGELLIAFREKARI